MSRFEAQLSKAHADSNWKRMFMVILVSLVIIFFVLYAFLFRQTPLKIVPEDAGERYRVEMEDGIGFVAFGRLLSLSTNLNLTVSSPGFYEKAITMNQSQLGKEQLVELLPLPASLRLSIEPKQQAQWFVDGSLVSSGESLEHDVQAGQRELLIVSSIGVQQSHQISVNRGDVFERVFKFPTVSGVLKLSAPPLSTITINGVDVVDREVELSGGDHRIEVKKFGYISLIDVVSIKREGEVVFRSYKLKPSPIKVDLDLSPKGGLLTINGLKVDLVNRNDIETPFQERLDISYFKEGYSQYRQTFSIQPGESIQFKAQLEAEYGRVKFSGTNGAVVLVDGSEIGRVPLEIELPTKEHSVTVKGEGLLSQTKSVLPRAARVTEHKFDLISVEEFKKKKSPRQYKSMFGLEFKLILAEGEQFSMGGHRNESGQRANELVRNIRFKKNFYVATTELTQSHFGQASDLPLVNTPWIEIAKFCNQASLKESLEPFYKINGSSVVGYNESANGYRLITEAEWEFLARKLGRSKQTIFTWGNLPKVPKGVGNLADQTSQATLKLYIPGYNDPFPELAPVKSFKSQPDGIYDLTGNVSEWVNDAYEIAPTSRQGQIEVDPLGGSPRSSVRTVKGSSFQSASLSELRAAFRDGTSEPRKDLGFRLARYM